MKDILIAQRYRLADLLGAGGEARVYRARDLHAERDVALRLAGDVQPSNPPAPPPDFHPNWVLLLDAGHDPQEGAYQAFELLIGETLRQKIERTPLAPETWRLFAREASDAIEALHTAGWVHADLHADNFLQNENPVAWKLLELPFLRFIPPTGRSALFGSIHTLAPEQMSGAPTSVLTDWYALGCIGYYAASGEYPHSGANSQEIVISRLRFPVVPLEEKVPHFPRAWCAWIMGLLEPDPARRAAWISQGRHLPAIA